MNYKKYKRLIDILDAIIENIESGNWELESGYADYVFFIKTPSGSFRLYCGFDMVDGNCQLKWNDMVLSLKLFGYYLTEFQNRFHYLRFLHSINGKKENGFEDFDKFVDEIEKVVWNKEVKDFKDLEK